MRPSEPWCNSDEEAQQLQFPVTLPLILCMVCAMAIIRDPNTPLAFWLSMFPLDLADHHVCAGLGEHAAGLADCSFDRHQPWLRCTGWCG